MTLLHGGPGAPGHMAPVARRLQDEFRVMELFERRSGPVPLSVALHVHDVEAAVADVVGDERCAVIGFSSGVVTALSFAACNPGRVGAVVVIGSCTFSIAAREELKRRLTRRMDRAALERLGELERLTDPEVRIAEQARLVTPFYLVDPIGAPEEVWLDGRGHMETWRDMLRLQEEGLHPEEFQTIRAPVLMLHGSEDPHPGELIRDSLAAVIPQIEYVELERCGHYPWLERPAHEEFFRILATWLDDLPGRDASL